MKRAIINVAAGSWYGLGQRRLGLSLDRHGEDADRLFWTDTFPPGSPPHSANPYAFKPYAFTEAKRQGYESVLWFDASVQLCRPIDDIWDWITSDGYCFGNDGWFVGQWCNDAGLEMMGLSRDEAWSIPLMDGKIIGLNLTHPKGINFLTMWKAYADLGVFQGSWEDHRHDITAGAVIAHRMGMKLRDNFLTMGDCSEGTYIKAAGM